MDLSTDSLLNFSREDMRDFGASVERGGNQVEQLSKLMDKLESISIASSGSERLTGLLGTVSCGVSLLSIVQAVKDSDVQYNLILNGLERGADVNETDNEGKTVLHHACYNGYLKTVSAIVNTENVNITLSDRDGNTPLIIACLTGRAEITEVLLTKAVDLLTSVQLAQWLSHMNSSGETAETMAITNGHADCVRLLRDKLSVLNKFLSISGAQQNSLDMISVVEYGEPIGSNGTTRETADPLMEVGSDDGGENGRPTSRSGKKIRSGSLCRPPSLALRSHSSRARRYLAQEMGGEERRVSGDSTSPGGDSTRHFGSSDACDRLGSSLNSSVPSNASSTEDISGQTQLETNAEFWRAQLIESRTKRVPSARKGNRRAHLYPANISINVGVEISPDCMPDTSCHSSSSGGSQRAVVQEMKKEQKTLKTHSKAQKIFQVSEEGTAYGPNRSFSERFRNAFVKKDIQQPLDRTTSDRHHNRKGREVGSNYLGGESLVHQPHLSPLVDLARSARTLVCPATVSAEPNDDYVSPTHLRLTDYMKPLQTATKNAFKLPPIRTTSRR